MGRTSAGCPSSGTAAARGRRSSGRIADRRGIQVVWRLRGRVETRVVRHPGPATIACVLPSVALASGLRICLDPDGRAVGDRRPPDAAAAAGSGSTGRAIQDRRLRDPRRFFSGWRAIRDHRQVRSFCGRRAIPDRRHVCDRRHLHRRGRHRTPADRILSGPDRAERPPPWAPRIGRLRVLPPPPPRPPILRRPPPAACPHASRPPGSDIRERA